MSKKYNGIKYELESDLLEISPDGVDQLVLRPVEIYEDRETDGWFTTGYYVN